MLMPITLVFAAVATLLNLWLSSRILRLRFAHGVVHGDGGHAILLRRMRAQSNYVEYTPFALILCGVVELALGSTTWLWGVTLAYIIGRVCHAFGMDTAQAGKLRVAGMLFTFLTLLILAGAALFAAYWSLSRTPAPPSFAAL